MNIEKNGIVFAVKENEHSWTLENHMGTVSVSYHISKSDCPDFESLTAFVLKSDSI